MSGSGREALSDVQEWSGGLPRCAGMFESQSIMTRSGWEALQDVWEW